MTSRPAASLAAALVLGAVPARAYRPFVATDAATAEPRVIEAEVGFFRAQHGAGLDTYDAPSVVLNWGLAREAEIVAELDAMHPTGSRRQALEPSLGVKKVLRDGALQDKPGLSLASETTLLLPAYGDDEKRAGFEQAGIASARLGPLTFHLNAGGGWERSADLPFAACGLIAELPVSARWRLVGELDGEAIRGETPDDSGLVGAIWSPGWRDAAFDAGYRRGLSAASPDWSVTVGVTLAFAAPF